MRRLLILRGGALGDFIVTLPALAAARATWPDVQLELVGNARAAALALRAAGRGPLDVAHAQSDARWAPLFAARPLPESLTAWLRHFDAIASFFPDPEGTIARHLVALGGPHVCAAAHPAQAPAAAHFVTALTPLGVQAVAPASPDWQSRLALSSADQAAGAAALGDWAAGGFIALHPGSGSARKNWPPTRWRELVLALLARGGRDTQVLVTAGEADADARAALQDLRVRFDPGWPLPVLAAVLARATVFLGHDSGVAHLAAAVGGPRCVLVWGPTDAAIWAPPGPHVRVLRVGADPQAVSVADVLAAVPQH